MHTTIPEVWLEPTISVIEWYKVVHVLNWAANMIVICSTTHNKILSNHSQPLHSFTPSLLHSFTWWRVKSLSTFLPSCVDHGDSWRHTQKRRLTSQLRRSDVTEWGFPWATAVGVGISRNDKTLGRGGGFKRMTCKKKRFYVKLGSYFGFSHLCLLYFVRLWK